MNVEETQHKASPIPENTRAARQTVGNGRVFTVLVLLVFAAIGWFVYRGINERVAAATALVTENRADSILTVSVVKPKVSGESLELVLPGNTLPLMEAPIYARTAGYVKAWHGDIGAKVKKGQVLAELDAPEVDHQLQQARADLETAKANVALSEITAERMLTLMKQDAVAKQDVDNAVGDRASKRSIVQSLTANVRRLEDLQSYEKIYAPFDGVITARNTDVGALVDAGTSGTAKELFHLVASEKLRVFINVPEQHDRDAKTGAKATLTLAEFPGRSFTGTIVRNSNSIDPVSRTLLVEVEVDNAKGELLPGAYVSVHLKLTGGTVSALTVPVNTLLFRAEGLRAAVLRNGKAELIPIQVGRDFGDTLEIVSGLRADDQLILNPPDSLVSGTAVRLGGNDAGK